MKSNNFDFIAPIYDFLALLVFGNSIRKAQTYFINQIPSNSKILVLGSGTGWIAEDILKIIPDADITLIDTSRKMISLSRKRLATTKVNIIQANENYHHHTSFDMIILPFYLDMFNENKIRIILLNLREQLNSEGFLIITDFKSEKRWHNAYLWIMYRFFKIVSSIEAEHLPQWFDAAKESGFQLIDQQDFFGRFIITTKFKIKLD